MKYDFVVVSARKNNFILADKKGNSYYMPKEFLQAIPDGNYLAIGDILHVITEKNLDMTELSSTDNIICHGEIKIFLKGSLLKQGEIKKFLVSNVSYGSVLLTELSTGKDYVIFNSYISDGYYISGTDWHAVIEGNIVKFLLFGNMPVMPVPRKLKIKAPITRSFWKNICYYTGAFNGASINDSTGIVVSGSDVIKLDSDCSGSDVIKSDSGCSGSGVISDSVSVSISVSPST